MKKITLIIFAALLSIINNAQQNTDVINKELSLKDAVLGYSKGLYPKSLSGLMWINDNKYAYRKNDSTIAILSSTADLNSRSAKNIELKDLKELIPELSKIPRANYLSESEIQFYYKNSYIKIDLKTRSIQKISFPKKALSKDISPLKSTIAYTLKNNLFIATEKDTQIVVTANKDKNIVSGQAIHRYEFGIIKGTFWCPDGKMLAFYQKDESEVADYPLLDINTTPGSLVTTKYPMAGQKSEKAKIGVYDLESDKLIYLDNGPPSDNYLTNLTWGPDSKYIYVAELNRDQDHMQLTKYSALNGEKVKVLFEEKNEKWVEPEKGLFFLPYNADEFIWMSERDGFMNLYLYNTQGKLIKQLTKNTWVTLSIIGFDKKNDLVYFTGTGEDPRNVHAFSVGIDSEKKVEQITEGNGIHKIKLSNNCKYLIDQFSSLTVTPTIQVLDLTKRKTKIIHIAENPLIDYAIGETEMLELVADDGTPLYARIIKPSDFSSIKKYPVLVYVYGGPHAQLVTNNWLGGAGLWMHWMAQKGYIIFTIDGRGSANRGFEFESIIHRKLGQHEITDQITGVKYLKSLPYVDSNRLAVHGWSYGGFMTTSLMLKTPGTFTTGVAGGPVIDWKWYEVMYGERYMDTPDQNPDGYKISSLLEYVNELKGNLLMIHGTADDVVVMQHNLAFIQKCVAEGVQVEFFPYPMHPHNVRGKDRVHLMTKVLNYILEKNL